MMDGVRSPEQQGLTPPQAEVLAGGLLESGFNCVLQMPTGSGKTWLAAHAIAKVLARGARAIYLTPLRALAGELTARWQEQFSPTAVGIFTGDFGRLSSYPVAFRDARLFVMTPERLDACTRAWRAHWCWIPEVDLVVVDEFHLLNDPHRGARLEGALSRFRRLNPFAQLLALSATLGNRHELADWLDGVQYGSTWRPIPLHWRVVRYKNAGDKPRLLIEEVSATAQAGGKSLVFVQSRRRAEELSRALSGLGLRASHHHAGLAPSERRKVEHGFHGSGIDLLVATATLEMGLNLPVRQVVLYDLQGFDGVEFRPLPTVTVWQRAGRAGRPGLDPEGKAVLFAPAWDSKAARYPLGDFEPILSGLGDSRAVAEQIVAEVASGLSRSSSQLEAIFGQSLAARQHRLPNVQAVVTQMLEAGMLSESHERKAGNRAPGLQELEATPIGRIAVRHMLAPETMLRIRRVLGSADTFTFLDLLLVATSTDDCEPILTVDFEELEALASVLAAERSAILRRPYTDVVATLGIDGKRLLSAIKASLVARAWTRTGDVGRIAERHDCYPFEVERLRESLDRLLLAMSDVLAATTEESSPAPLIADEIPLSEKVHALHQMVVTGLDESSVTLTLVSGIGPQMARRLVQAGIADVEDLALADTATLAHVRGLSAARAARWIEQAQDVVQSRSALCFRDIGPTLSLGLPAWPGNIDPYRLRRALDLTIQAVGDSSYRVTGGLEPHTVDLDQARLHCDCVDASHGVECKHMLAVRFHRGDQHLRHLAKGLRATAHTGTLDLFGLWLQGRAQTRVDRT
jgi:helicase